MKEWMNREWIQKMATTFRAAICDVCGESLQFGQYPSSEFWTYCPCGNHIPQCLGRDEDYELFLTHRK